MNIHYAHSDYAWRDAVPFIERMILERKARRVLEVGAGANPTFAIDFVRAHGIDYALLDISKEELAKAPDGYVKIEADITAPTLDLPGGYDIIFSRMLAEHVHSGELFHRNIRALLRAGGIAFHFFPTLYSPPFVVNRLMPEALAARILQWLQPERRPEGNHAKFPAYYSWCRGPLKHQIARLEALGYNVEEYIGFFGHGGYYAKIKWAHALHEALSRWLVSHPAPFITSFAYVVLAKK
jgi:uncharacterized UPF0146 family protein